MAAEREVFVGRNIGKTIDIEKLMQDARAMGELQRVGVSAGQIQAAAEAGVLDACAVFKIADHFDQDGSSGSLSNAQAQRVLSVLESMMGKPELQAGKISRNDFVLLHGGQQLDVEAMLRDPEARRALEALGFTPAKVRETAGDDRVMDATEAFKLADGPDNDGRSATVKARDGRGRETVSSKALSTLGEMMLQGRFVAGPGGGRRAPERTNDIVFVGVGDDSPSEVRELRRYAQVIPLHDSRAGDDKVEVNGRVYDLTADADRLAFARTLGLGADQTQRVADAIGQADSDAKDELAQLAQIWARIEKDEIYPTRFVISGHHVGSAVWGDTNGWLSWEALKGLAQAMPKGAGAVEDLNISACYSAGESKKAMYREIFPNVKTIWAYSGSAPGSYSGATAHQKYWERRTRGDDTGVEEAAQQLVEWGTRKAENIEARRVDVQSGSEAEKARLLADVQAFDRVFQGFFTGTTVVESSQHGPLREDYYQDLQDLLRNYRHLLQPEQLAEITERRDQTIRLLFYTTHVGPKFQRQYEQEISAGYRSLGLAAPDFGRLSRAEAQEAIWQFRNALANARPEPQAARALLPLLNGLWNLSPEIIPERWI